MSKMDEIIGDLCDDWKRLHFSQMTVESLSIVYICIQLVDIHIIVMWGKKAIDKSHIKDMTYFNFDENVNQTMKLVLALLNFKFFGNVNRDACADALACYNIKPSIMFAHDPAGDCQSESGTSGAAGA